MVAHAWTAIDSTNGRGADATRVSSFHHDSLAQHTDLERHDRSDDRTRICSGPTGDLDHQAFDRESPLQSDGIGSRIVSPTRINVCR